MTTHQKSAPASLVSFPSMSSSLHSLPHATSMQSLPLHPSMYTHGQRSADSEAKLKQALSKTAQNGKSAYPMQSSLPAGDASNAPSLMMRKPQKSK